MIVLGADTHKRSHTIAAVSAATGELLGEPTVQVGAKGFAALVSGRASSVANGCGRWRTAGSLGLLRAVSDRTRRARRASDDDADGRVAPPRPRARESDSIDAIAVARAALREGLDALPAARLEGPGVDLRLLVDHREQLVRQRVALDNTVQWRLTSSGPTGLPGSSRSTAPGPARRPPSCSHRADDRRPDRSRRAAPHPRAARRSRRSSPDRRPGRRDRAAASVRARPRPLTAAKLVGEIAGAERFASDAKLARAAGVAPIPVSSGNTNRHRLDRGGNRQINATIHRIAVTRLRCTPRPATTSPANAPKAKPPAKPSAASNATSPAASGTYSKPTPPPRPRTIHTINLLT